jgi:iron complex transport system ATP-binding protein
MPSSSPEARHQPSAAIVLVTHHLEEIPPGFHRALVLAGGRAIASGPIERALTGATLSKAYGMALRLEVLEGRYSARRDASA